MTETALSARWLRRARRLNPHYKMRLHWSVPAGWPDDVAGREFAERVAAFPGGARRSDCRRHSRSQDLGGAAGSDMGAAGARVPDCGR